ncbi:hypothetical protein SMG44B_30435 [Stenotrophomonas maltophilia]
MRGTAQVRPCSLDRAIHGAHAPATGPTPPSTGSRDLPGLRTALLLVGVDHGRHVSCLWWVTTVGRHRSKRSEATRFCFSFLSSVAGRARKLSEAGRGGLRRGVSRMDAATELTWTYLQRPLRSPPRPAKHGFCFQ